VAKAFAEWWVAGFLSTLRFTAGSAVIGDPLLLSSIAAVIIGGVSLFGGAGTVIGTVIGSRPLLTSRSKLAIIISGAGTPLAIAPGRFLGGRRDTKAPNLRLRLSSLIECALPMDRQPALQHCVMDIARSRALNSLTTRGKSLA
jgi:hypothetical protein